MKTSNVYFMNNFGLVKGFNTNFYKLMLSKTTFRNIKKGGFYTTKKDFKVNNLSHKRDITLKDDGSLLVKNNFNKRLFKRLGAYYPIY